MFKFFSVLRETLSYLAIAGIPRHLSS